MLVGSKDKDKIYAFFVQNNKSLSLDNSELEDDLQKNKEEPINNITLALIYEYSDNYEGALKIWSILKS